jgi:aryl-alcohol dehydrogenase-like predicted oxidoreductase
MGMSAFYGPTDEERSLKTLNRALDLGMTFWDTADVYGSGANEILLAKVLRDRRDDVVLATKFAFSIGEDGSFHLSGAPDYVRKACDASLQRLGVDHVDLYYQHRVDPQVPIEETVGAMADLVKAGKVRHLGLSEAGSESLRRASKVHPIAALQTEYSLWSREVEADILPTCRELGIGFVPYSPIGRGFLSGQIQSPSDLAPDDFRLMTPRFQGENFQKNLDLVARIRELAGAKGCTPAQMAIAWVLAQGDDMAPIPGTTRPERVEENAGAADLVLTDAEMASIEEAFPADVASGERYPEGLMDMCDS